MFIAREKEMQTLIQMAESNKFEFMVIYGRRRVGKTELLNQLAKKYKTLFYSAQEKNDAMNLLSFSERTAEYYHLGKGFYFSSWENAFEFIGNQEEERLILIIDEFPFIALENPTIMSILEHIIDHNWSKKNIKLILCGSSISFMEKEVLSSKSPLYGRRTGSMEIKPFDYYDASLFTENLSAETKAYIYGIFGGIPKYLELYDADDTLKKNIESQILKNTSYLFEEPTYLLKTELREISVYNSILEALANGNAKISEIANQIHEENTKTSKYINVLNQLRITEKIVPATEEIAQSKKTLYQFQDNFFHFWYRFVFPHKQEIELFGEEIGYQFIENNLNQYMGSIFEKMCMEYLIRLVKKGQLSFIPQHIGKWWGANPYRKNEKGYPMQDDIDILMYNKDYCLLGECKFKNENFKVEDFMILTERAKMFHQEHKLYYLFSKKGFDKKLIQIADENTHVHLITLDNLYSI